MRHLPSQGLPRSLRITIGKSDDIGAYPTTPAYSPDDLGATVYSALGIEPHSVVRDRLGRPVHLNTGNVIESLYTGRDV